MSVSELSENNDRFVFNQRYFLSYKNEGFKDSNFRELRVNLRYFDGEEVYLGDEVIADDSEGIVVGVIDSGQFSDDFQADWSHLGRGMLVETKKWGLIHYPETDEDVIFVKRAKA